MSARVDRGPRVHHDRPPTDLPTLLEQFGAYRQSAGMCQPGSPEQRHYLGLANDLRHEITDRAADWLAATLDTEFGRTTRPAKCPECHNGEHTDRDGRGYCLCRFCLCMQRLTVPAEIAAELTLVGAS